jgi:hypothetical protein
MSSDESELSLAATTDQENPFHLYRYRSKSAPLVGPRRQPRWVPDLLE